MNELTTLGEVLNNDARYDTNYFLYLPMDEIWEISTKCAVLSQSDVDSVPEVALRNGLSYAVEIAAIKDVVANAREQNANASLAQLLRAFLFYYDNDAFITLTP